MDNQILCHTSKGLSCGSMTSQPFMLMTGVLLIGSTKEKPKLYAKGEGASEGSGFH